MTCPATRLWHRWAPAWPAMALLAVLPAIEGCRAAPNPRAAAQPGAVAEEEAPVEWIRVPLASGGVLRAAVARPAPGGGPFPAVLILHGRHGFAEEYVRLARDLAKSGVVAVAACWFASGEGAGVRFVKSLPCPDAPPIVTVSPAALERVGALMATVRALPSVRPERLALFGHSRGGGAALMYSLNVGGVQALVLNSAGYPPEVTARTPDVSAPILILHGIRDDPADGGSALTAVDRARAFEAALRAAGKEVDATYFEAGHNGLFDSAAQYDATVRRIGAFLRQHLIP